MLPCTFQHVLDTPGKYFTFGLGPNRLLYVGDEYVRRYKSRICYLEHSSMYCIPQADTLPSILVERRVKINTFQPSPQKACPCFYSLHVGSNITPSYGL